MVKLIPTFLLFFLKFGKFSGVTNVYRFPPPIDLAWKYLYYATFVVSI